MTIGEKIKKRRIELGIMQNDLAVMINVSKQTLYKYENNIISNIPSDKIEEIAKVLNVSPAHLMGWEEEYPKSKEFEVMEFPKMVNIPVYGRIPAGVAMEAIEDVDGEVAIPQEWLKNNTKEYFALKIKGSSMEPRYMDGDIIIVRSQEDFESGQDCIVFVNGYDATFKKVIKGDGYVTLQPYNSEYEQKTYVGKDLDEIKVIGVVKQLVRMY